LPCAVVGWRLIVPGHVRAHRRRSALPGTVAFPVLCEPRPVPSGYQAQQSPRRAHLRRFLGPPACRPTALLGTDLLLLAQDSWVGARLVRYRGTCWTHATELS